MQTEKGITLISITIYIIVMLIIVSIITVLTSYFYKNVDIRSINEDLNQQYTKFNSYFIKEVNKKGNKIVDIHSLSKSKSEKESLENNSNQQNYIVFSSGNQYTYIPENEGIYMNKVKIAQNITGCTFTANKEANGKTTVTVIIQGNNFEKETTYTLVE